MIIKSVLSRSTCCRSRLQITNVYTFQLRTFNIVNSFLEVYESDGESDDETDTHVSSQSYSQKSDSSDESKELKQVGNGAMRGTKRYRSETSDDERNQYRPPTSRIRETQESDCDCSECEGY